MVLVGHGSHLSPDSSTPIREHRRRLLEAHVSEDVRVAFWREEPALGRALDDCESDEVIVVPVLISDGYFVREVIPREMGLTGRVTRAGGRCIRYADPIGAHPALASVIAQRAEEAGADARDGLAVLGHGTPRNPQSAANVFLQANYLTQMDPAREVAAMFIDQEPNMRDLFRILTAQSVVVVPLFVANGWHVGETIPEDLALDGRATSRDGRNVRYAAAVGTHPRVAEVIAEMVEEASRW